VKKNTMEWEQNGERRAVCVGHRSKECVCVEISPQMHYERDSVFPEAFTTVNAKPLLNLWRATRKAHMPIDAGHPLPVLI